MAVCSELCGNAWGAWADGEFPVPEGLHAKGRGPPAFPHRAFPSVVFIRASGCGDRDGTGIYFTEGDNAWHTPATVRAQQLSAAIRNDYLSPGCPFSAGEEERGAEGRLPGPAAPTHRRRLWDRSTQLAAVPADGAARVPDSLSSHFNPNVPLIALVKLPWLSPGVFFRG